MITHRMTPTRKLLFRVTGWLLGNNEPLYRRNPVSGLPCREAFDQVVDAESDWIVVFVDLDGVTSSPT